MATHRTGRIFLRQVVASVGGLGSTLGEIVLRIPARCWQRGGMRDSHCHLLLGCDSNLPSKPMGMAPSRLAAWPHRINSIEADKAASAASLWSDYPRLAETDLAAAIATAWPQLPAAICTHSAELIHALWPEFTLAWLQGDTVQERLLSFVRAKAAGVSDFCLQSTCCLDFLVTALTLKRLAARDGMSGKCSAASAAVATTTTDGEQSAALPAADDVGAELAAFPSRCQLYTGIHPLFIVADAKEQEQELRWWSEAIVGNAAAWGCAGIGEIGLDARKSAPDMQYQLRLLEQILESTVALQLPYSFHCVRAHNELLRLLKRFSRNHNGLRGTIHGFNQNALIAAQYVELGFSLGLGPEILREHNAPKFKQLVAAVPASALVVETDFSGGSGNGYEGTVLAAVTAKLEAWLHQQ